MRTMAPPSEPCADPRSSPPVGSRRDSSLGISIASKMGIRKFEDEPPIGRRNLEQDDYAAIWERFTGSFEEAPISMRITARSYTLMFEVGEFSASPSALYLLSRWTYPATPGEMALAIGTEEAEVQVIADVLLRQGMLDDLCDGRMITNHEGLVHSRDTKAAGMALHVLFTSTCGRLHYDEIQMRTNIMDDMSLSSALSSLKHQGLVHSSGILYEVARLPVSSRALRK